MADYLLKRLILTAITIVLLGFAIFAIVQIPPGDAVDAIVRGRLAMGDAVSDEEIQALYATYGLDRPFIVRYLDWFGDFLRGDMGLSVSGRPVSYLINERLPQTLGLSLLSMVVTYVIAIPIGIYSATHQYSIGDYLATGYSFIGLATPSFLLAIILLFLFYRWFGISIGGFNSPEFKGAALSWAKFWDTLQHLLVPVLVVAFGSTAGIVRTLRATLLDELGKQYVMTARSKGVPWRKLLFKYPVRLALNPIVAGIGYVFPALLAGQTILAIVLNLPTLGPLLFSALITQDVELSTSVLMIQSLLGILGVVFSDILLSMLDPRIRLEKGAS